MKSDEKHLRKYINLISEFINGEILASEFEDLFFKIYSNEEHFFEQEVFLVLDALSGDIDGYCSNPSLRDENDLDDIQLLEKAKLSLSKLMK